MLMYNTKNVPERFLGKLLHLHDLQQQVVYAAKYIAEEVRDLDLVEEVLDDYIEIATRFTKKVAFDERIQLSEEVEQ